MRPLFKRLTIAAAGISFAWLFAAAYPNGSPLTIVVPLAILGFYRVVIWIATGEPIIRIPKREPSMSPCKAASLLIKKN